MYRGETDGWVCRLLGVFGKLKIGSDFCLKKLNHPKIQHPFRRFFDRNCMQSAIQIKSAKK